MSNYKGRGRPFEKEDPTIKEFREEFEEVAKEITVDGELIMSHKIPCTVQIRCINNDKSYTLVGMDVNALGGCGCWADIILEIEETDETIY